MQSDRKQRRRCGQLGQGLVELALLLPLLLAILFGTVDLGRAFYTYVALTNAAREAARYAAVMDSNASKNQVLQEFEATNGTDISGCADNSVTFSSSGGGRGQDYTVTVGCRFTLMTPFMSVLLNATNNQLTISSTATFVWN